jgi:hypothetical protein
MTKRKGYWFDGRWLPDRNILTPWMGLWPITTPVLRLTEETRRSLLQDGFGQVSWMVYVDSVLDGKLVGEELQGHYLEHGG